MIANDELCSPVKNNDRIGQDGWMPTIWGKDCDKANYSPYPGGDVGKHGNGTGRVSAGRSPR